MKKKAEKNEHGEELRAQLATVSTVILSTFQGITVEQDTQAAARRGSGGRPLSGGEEHGGRARRRRHSGRGLLKNLKGTNSIAYTKTDPVALAKILTKVAKDVPAFQVPRGMGGRPRHFDPGNSAAGALPSKEELISKVMFLLNAPAQRVATVLAAVPRNLAVVTSEAVKAEQVLAGTGSGGAGG